ncbi:MAG TPA: SMP-30/gluconolactonase/LRE family protein [Gammaproteobacteria bacterium]|jgi:gluconolactonase|nr:SMP-30/gluconolactonase/LRE family protein [Gammaproteobacteria bacterium]
MKNEDAHGSSVTRRALLGTVGFAGSAALLAPGLLSAQNTTPPRDFSPGAAPALYPDPDVLVIDPSFNALRVFNSPIQRLYTGALWSEGPAWSSQGRYLVWSDIPNNRQLRWLEDDGRVTVFRQPSNNSNGNTFDFQGRQVTCEHLTRRVVRYENDGSVTVLAAAYDGKPLNSPNDVAPHPDGSYWFTDPPFGGQLYEGAPDAAGGPSNAEGKLQSRVGQPVGAGTSKRELPTNVYRVDPSGRVAIAIGASELPGAPNGVAFSPDYKKVYVVANGDLYVADVGTNGRATGLKRFAEMKVDGVACRTDGVRADVYGNLWCSSNAGTVGYSGVTVWNAAGALIGRIRLPEVCANVAFGGAKRNRLFMAASQSLYAVHVNTQGAAPG